MTEKGKSNGGCCTKPPWAVPPVGSAPPCTTSMERPLSSNNKTKIFCMCCSSPWVKTNLGVVVKHSVNTNARLYFLYLETVRDP